jgi:hypothetical protein
VLARHGRQKRRARSPARSRARAPAHPRKRGAAARSSGTKYFCVPITSLSSSNKEVRIDGTQSSHHDAQHQACQLRITQSRWQAAQQSQQKAAANFEKPAAEAGQHKQTLLRFFDRRFNYWYAGTDKFKDYAAFPATASSTSVDDEEDDVPQAPADGVATTVDNAQPALDRRGSPRPPAHQGSAVPS